MMTHSLPAVSDSYGSWPRDGMQEGHRYSLGAYYSCLEVGGHGENYDDGDRWEPTEPAPFSTQYCQVRMRGNSVTFQTVLPGDIGWQLPTPFPQPDKRKCVATLSLPKQLLD